MRDYSGIGWSSLPDPSEPDFVSRMRSMLGTVDYFLRDLSRGVQRIQVGQVPDGSGSPLPIDPGNPGLDDYVYMPGRLGGQMVNAIAGDTSPTIGVRGTDVGVAFQRWQAPVTQTIAGCVSDGSTTVTSAALFGNVAIGMLVTGSLVPVGAVVSGWNSTSSITLSMAVPTGNSTMQFANKADFSLNASSEFEWRGSAALNLIMTGGITPTVESGIRMVAAGNGTAFSNLPRGWIQAGPTNLNMALTGFNAANGNSLHVLYNYSSFNSWGGIDTDFTSNARLGINADPFDHSGSAAASQPDSLQVRRRPLATSGVATVTLEDTASSAEPAISARVTSGGSRPNKTLGVLNWSIGHDGNIYWYSSGTRRGRISPILSGTGAGGLTFLNSDDRLVFESLPETGAFADSASSLYLRIANTGTEVNRLMLASQGTAPFSRLGILATSVLLGPCGTGTMPAPVSSRLLTLVNSSGTVLSGFNSTGNHFHVSGAGAGLVWTSDASGVGSWAAIGTLTADFADNAFSIHDDGDATKLLVTSLGGATTGKTMTLISSHTDNRSVTLPNATTTLAGLAVAQTFTTSQTVQPTSDVTGLSVDGTNISTAPIVNVSSSGTNLLQVDAAGIVNLDNLKLHAGGIGSGADALFDAGALLGSRTITLVDASGTMVLNSNSQALTNKSIQSGAVTLTGQTGNISDNITITPSSTNNYMVEVYAMCTTASGSGAPTLDVTIGWTDTVGATTLTLAAGNDNSLFPLSLAATGRAFGRVFLRRASGNLTYATTINAASGTPQYALSIRVLNLG